MRKQVKERGKSEGHPVMGRIEGEIAPHAKAGRLPHGLHMTRKPDQTTKKGKQMTEEPQEGSTGAPFHDVTDWHAIDWESATHNVRRLQARIVKATKAKEMGQGESLATPLNPLVQRQSPCRATSDGKPGQTYPRSRQDYVEHSTQEDQRRLLAQAKGISSPTASAHPYPQEKWQNTSIRYPMHEGQSHASSVLACA